MNDQSNIIEAGDAFVRKTVYRYFVVYRWGNDHWATVGGGHETAEAAADLVISCDGEASNPNAYRIVKVCGLPVNCTKEGAV